jgi:uncharacterized protein (TIRG00374 family)
MAKLSPFRWILSSLVFVALSGGVPFLIYRKIGAQNITVNPGFFSSSFVAGVLGLLFLYFLTDALRLYYVLRVLGHRLRVLDLGKLTFINILFSNITPLATGGGFAQIWYLSRRGVPLGVATAATTLRTLLAMGFIFLPVPFLVLKLPLFRGSEMLTRSGLFLGFFAGAYLSLFLLMLFRLKWFLWVFDMIANMVARTRMVKQETLVCWRRRLFKETVHFSRCLTMYLRGEKRDLLLSVGCTVVFLISLFSFPSLLLWGAGYSFSYFQVTGMLVVSTCLMYFAPSPGGAGFAEGVFGIFFASLVRPSDLVGIIVIWRFLTIYLGMLIGIPVVLYELFRGGSKNA